MSRLKSVMFAVLFLSSVLSASTFNNILNVTVPFGRTSTLLNPNLVLRPFKGNLLRVNIPLSCGFAQVLQISAVGRTLGTNFRLPLSLVLRNTESDFGYSRFTYIVNGNSPATIREIGLDVQTNSITGCKIELEQANDFVIPPMPNPEGCSEAESIYCPQHIDSTRYCVALSGIPSGDMYEYSSGSDNSCKIEQRLKSKLCAKGLSPKQFSYSCN